GTPIALGAEHDRSRAQVPGGVSAGRTSTLRFADGDRLSLERRLDAGVEHVNREPQTRYREPVLVGTNLPEAVARVTGRGCRNGEACSSAAEVAVVDHGAVVGELRVATVDRAREVAGPVVLEAAASRPARGELQAAAVDVDRVGQEAER